jgi:hypothetical protein
MTIVKSYLSQTQGRSQSGPEATNFAQKLLAGTQPTEQLIAPERMKRLEKFPELGDGAYQEALKRYGQFNLPKKPEHESFTELKTFGPLLMEDGTIYEGQWRDSKRVGLGKALFQTGGYYDGYWVNDRPSLLGRIIDTSGDVYEVCF